MLKEYQLSSLLHKTKLTNNGTKERLPKFLAAQAASSKERELGITQPMCLRSFSGDLPQFSRSWHFFRYLLFLFQLLQKVNRLLKPLVGEHPQEENDNACHHSAARYI